MDDLRGEIEKLEEAYINEFDRFCKDKMKEEYRRRHFIVCSDRKNIKRAIKHIRKAIIHLRSGKGKNGVGIVETGRD